MVIDSTPIGQFLIDKHNPSFPLFFQGICFYLLGLLLSKIAVSSNPTTDPISSSLLALLGASKNEFDISHLYSLYPQKKNALRGFTKEELDKLMGLISF